MSKLSSIVAGSLLFLAATASGQVTSIQSGSWTNPQTWGGTLPAAGQSVVVASGHEVTLENTQVTVNGVYVNGRLKAGRSGSAALSTPYLIANGGVIDFGLQGDRVLGNLTVTLTGTNTASDLMGMGTKVLGATNGGQISIHGKDGVLGWTKLTATADVGATSLTFTDPVAWQVGDKIVIVASDMVSSFNEVRTIASLSGDQRTVTLTNGLTHKHSSGVETHTRNTPNKTWTLDRRTEVGLLTRNVQIQGDVSSETSFFGGHTMIMPGSSAYVDGASFYRMGQRGIKGRYPFHWHMVADQASGQYFKNSAVWLSFNKAVTVHGTNSVVVNNNVFHDHLGHGVFLEDGGERFNQFRNNLIVGTTRPPAGTQPIPSDNSHQSLQNQSPAAVWITNPNNIFVDNVVAGTDGTGYWFIPPVKPIGPSATHPSFSTLVPWTEPLGEFKGNTVHTSATGFDFFDQLGSDHSVLPNQGWNPPSTPFFDDVKIYGNRLATYSGLNEGTDLGLNGRRYVFRNLISASNDKHLMHASRLDYQESVFIARTSNNLMSNRATDFWVHYDHGGNIENSHFVGFTDPSNGVRFSESISSGNEPNADAYFRGITTNTAAKLPMIFNNKVNLSEDLQNYTHHFEDLDGTLTGVVNGKVIPNHPFVRSLDDTTSAGYVNTRISRRNIGTLWTQPRDTFSVVMKRSKAGTPDAFGYYENKIPAGKQMKHAVFLNENYEYTHYFKSLPSSKELKFSLWDGSQGSSTIIRLYGKGGFPGARFENGGVQQKSSYTAMQSATSNAYFLQSNGDAFLKIYSQWGNNVSFRWNNTGLLGLGSPPSTPTFSIDSDGDGINDSTELAMGRSEKLPGDLNLQRANGTDSVTKWTRAGISSAVDVSGAMNFISNSNDPYIENSGMNFDGSSIRAIDVTLRSEVSGNFQLFWGNDDSVGSYPYSDSRMVNSSQSYTAGTGFQVVRFDVSQHPKFQGYTITDLRIDFVGQTGKLTEIKEIDGAGDTYLNLNGSNVQLGELIGGGWVENSGAGVPTLTINNATDNTFTGNLGRNGPSFAFTKTGNGTLSLNGLNSYTGATTVNGGTLIANSTLAPSSTLSVASGATFQANTNNVFGGGPTAAWTVAGTLQVGSSGGGQTMPTSVTLNGGTLSNLASNEVYGNFLQTGTSIQANATGNTISARIGMFGNLTLNTPNSGDTLAIPGSLGATAGGGNSGGLIKNGTGTVTLSGANTYTGETIVNGGTLRIQNSMALGLGGFNATSWTVLSNGASLEIDGSLNVDEHMQLGGSGVGGSGALRAISGASSFTQNQALFSDATINVASGASLSLTGIIYGAPGLTKSGSGLLQLTQENLYEGATNINSGTLRIRNSKALGLGGFNATSWTVLSNGASLEVDGSLNIDEHMQIGGSGVGGSGALSVISGASSLTQNQALFSDTTINVASGASLSLNGIIYGAAGLTKFGAGQLYLNTANIYTGATKVLAGTLAINGNSITDTGTLRIEGSGKVNLSGVETVAALFYGTVRQPAGTYFANGTTLTGSGSLVVTSSTGPTQPSQPPAAGFTAWAESSDFSLALGDQAPAEDPDSDGISNLLEYALSGDPSISDHSVFPKMEMNASHFEFLYSRSDRSLADTTGTFEYCGNLGSWTGVAIPANPGVSVVGLATVTIVDEGAVDSVKVSIPRSANTTQKLFGRLRVELTTSSP